MENKKSFITLLIEVAKGSLFVLQMWSYWNYVTSFPGSHFSSMEGK